MSSSKLKTSPVSESTGAPDYIRETHRFIARLRGLEQMIYTPIQPQDETECVDDPSIPKVKEMSIRSTKLFGEIFKYLSESLSDDRISQYLLNPRSKGYVGGKGETYLLSGKIPDLWGIVHIMYFSIWYQIHNGTFTGEKKESAEDALWACEEFCRKLKE